jgi:hypothetical protein
MMMQENAKGVLAMKNVLSLVVLMACLSLSLSCKKDQATAPVEPSPAQYAGVWTGTTDQSLPVYFRVTQTGVVDSLTVRIRLYVGMSTCTGTFVKDSACMIQGGAFVARVMLPGSSVSTRMRTTLSSPGAAGGTYDGYSGSFSIICGSSYMVGTGSIMGKTIWQATKTGQ